MKDRFFPLKRWYRPCPICGIKEIGIVFENRLAPINGLDLGYQVIHCKSCNFTFTDGLAPVEEYDAYYHTLSKYDVAPSIQVISAVDRKRAEQAVEFCCPYLSKAAFIADLRCGSGILLDAFRRAGWMCLVGLDPAPAAPEQAKRLFGLDNVKSGTLEEAPAHLPMTDLDLVCLTGVLEHLPRLREDLDRLTSCLNSNTMLLVEVPALERFCRPPFEPFGEFSLEHIQFFSANSLTRLLAIFGYYPIELTILDLPVGYTDSLIGLFVRKRPNQVSGSMSITESGNIFDYVHKSEELISSIIEKIIGYPAERFVIYGAGSHTARLLPRLLDAGLGSKLIGLVDKNPNLHGKKLGMLLIQPPEVLSEYPDATILISSFRSQMIIADELRCRFSNPLLLLY